MILPYEGRKLACERILGKRDNGFNTAAGRLCLRLLSTDVQLNNATVFEDITEASGTWYATRQFLASEWSAAADNGSNNALVTSPAVLYEYSGASAGATIYGWALTTDPTLGDDKILFCDKFATPKTMAALGDEFGFALEFASASLSTGMTLPNEGKVRIMDRLFGKVNGQRNLSLRLFKNNIALAAEANLEDFSTATYSGYADQPIVYSGWASAILNQTNRGQCSHATTVVFTHNGGSIPNTVYGYVVHEDGIALWAEKYSAAKSMNQGNPYSYLKPRFEIGANSGILAMTTGETMEGGIEEQPAEEQLEEGIITP